MSSCNRTLLLGCLGITLWAMQFHALSADNSEVTETELEEVLSGFNDTASTPDDAKAEILEGFNDPAPISQPTTRPTRLPAWLNGSITLSSGYRFKQITIKGTDHQRLSRLRAKLNLEVRHQLAEHWRFFTNGYTDYDLAYRLNGRQDYTTDVLDEYEHETELGELYIQGRLRSNLDIKVGRQIVIWGKSDNLRVTDMLNPLDQREIGLVDIEDLRLPLTMVKLDYYQGDWNISALLMPELRFNKRPPWGAEFYPFSTPLPPEDKPTGSEFALAANGIFSGWDLSFYAGRLYNDTTHSVNTATRPRQQHARLTMLGTAFNWALGNWLLKAEIAHLRGLRYTGLAATQKNRTDGLLGAEYAGFDNTTLSIEVVDRHIHSAQDSLTTHNIEQNAWELALRYQSDLMHDRLHLTALATRVGDTLQGGFSRLSLGYDLVDAMTLTGGIVLYHGGESVPFNAIGDNDRLFLELVYSF